MKGIVFDAKTTGSRYATRVRVQAPQGSCFDGYTGVVARDYGDTLIVRLHMGRLEVELPFGRGELVTL